MMLVVQTALLLCWVLGSAVFSGSETGLYSVSRARIQLEDERRPVMRWVRRLLRDDTALLITLLIGNNLMNQLATYQAEDLAQGLGVPEIAVEVAVTLGLTPLLFFFGEVFPKELFRRRPHGLLSVTALPVLVFRYAVWPLERFLWGIVTYVPRLFGSEPRLYSEMRGREAVVRLIEEGAVTGAIEPHAQALAHNVLGLRGTLASTCMKPWADVEVLREQDGDEASFQKARASQHTRLPYVDADGRVLGYLHQLDVLRRGEPAAVREELRSAVAVPIDASVDRALSRMRASGQRLAIVGSLAEPVGLLTLKDLVEEISGELGDW